MIKKIIDRVIENGRFEKGLLRSITPREAKEILDFLNARDGSARFSKLFKYTKASDIDILKKIRG